MRERSSGQALILFVFALLTLLACFALVVDSAQVYLERRRAQNVADAAALAGAYELPDEVQATSVAGEYATLYHRRDEFNVWYTEPNGFEVSNLTVTANAVTVEVSRTVPLLFGGVLSLTDVTVSAVAEASAMTHDWSACVEFDDTTSSPVCDDGGSFLGVSPLIATQCLNNWSLPTRYVEFATPVAEVRIDLWVSFETRVCVAPGEVTDAGPRFGCGATQWQNLVVQPNDELEYYFPLATACPVQSEQRVHERRLYRGAR